MRNPGKFKRSWQLFGNSLQVLRQNKKLLLFPILGAFFAVLIALFFIAPIVFQNTGHSLGQEAHWSEVRKSVFNCVFDIYGSPSDPEYAFKTGSIFFLAGIYFVSMFLATFCNVAFYHESMKALAGKSVSIRSGFSFAMTRIRSILLWSFFAGLIGVIIQTLEEYFGWFGSLVLRLVGVVWSVASVFVIPVIIREENSNPIHMLKHSAATIKKTWGESLIGFAGLQIGLGLVLVASIVLVLAASFTSVLWGQFMIFAVVMGVWLLAIISLGFLANVGSHIYRCALYIYASEGVLPAPYTSEMLDAAWKVKKR